MTSLKKKNLSILVAVVLAAAGAAAETPTLTCDILQFKLERLYFSAGVEDLVFPGCRFELMRGNDTIYRGEIEQSFEGVSISRAVFNFNDTLRLDTCLAVIEPAAVDSASAIALGCFEYDPVEIMVPPYQPVDTGEALRQTIGHTAVGNPVTVERTDLLSLITGYSAPAISGYLSLSPFPESARYNQTMLSAPAPFLAALIPNPASSTNREGLLTTSLYYRFDLARIFPLFAQGDSPRPIFRLYPVTGQSPRAYPFDPEQGRRLLAKHKNRPGEVAITVTNAMLSNIGQFFADVLAQDKIGVKIFQHNFSADLILEFVPIDRDDPLVSLEYIYARLAGFQPHDSRTKETLGVIRGYLNAAAAADDATTLFHFVRLADRSLQQDLGVFPLFRPAVYFMSGSDLINVRFDDSGRLDINSLTKLSLPSTEEVGP